MAPARLTPPLEFSPTYCADVHKLCTNTMQEVKEIAEETRAEVKKKLSLKTIKGLMIVFGAPVLAACLALYAFYVQAPLIYADKEEMHTLQTKIVIMETKLGSIPDKDELREIVTDVVKKNR